MSQSPMPDSRPPIAVLGAGSWGTALALLLARNGHPTRLWGHEAAEMDLLIAARSNEAFLPGIKFPDNLHPCSDWNLALADCSDVMVVVPSHAFRQVITRLSRQQQPIRLAWATKGLEPERALLLHEVATEILGDSIPLAVISGPSFAREVAAGQPTAVTIAATVENFATDLAGYLGSDCFRAYTSADLIGVELGGSVKNVLAIAAGIADGLGFGANARSALITRGLAEMMRLGDAMGGQRETLMGLSGVGDLILTCTDNQSRNRRFGMALGRGINRDMALKEIGQEVEGILTAREIWSLAQKHQVDMPITEQTYRVLYEEVSPAAAVHSLLAREQRPESD